MLHVLCYASCDHFVGKIRFFTVAIKERYFEFCLMISINYESFSIHSLLPSICVAAVHLKSIVRGFTILGYCQPCLFLRSLNYMFDTIILCIDMPRYLRMLSSCFYPKILLHKTRQHAFPF